MIRLQEESGALGDGSPQPAKTWAAPFVQLDIGAVTWNLLQRCFNDAPPGGIFK